MEQAKSKNEDPYNGAVWTTITIIWLHFLLLISLPKYFWNINIFQLLPSVYMIIPLAIASIFLGFRYYNRERVRYIVDKYSQKSILERRMWGGIAILSMIAPICMFPILFSK